MAPHEDPAQMNDCWDTGQLVRGSVFSFLRADNLQGFDVYLLPYADYGNAGQMVPKLEEKGRKLTKTRFTACLRMIASSPKYG